MLGRERRKGSRRVYSLQFLEEELAAADEADDNGDVGAGGRGE